MRGRRRIAGPLFYDQSIGLGVDSTGIALLQKHASAKYVWVHPTLGSDANTGLSFAQAKQTVKAGWNVCVGAVGDWLLLPKGLSFTEGIGFVYGRSGLNASYPFVVTTYDPDDPSNTAKFRTGSVTLGTAPTETTLIAGIDNAPSSRWLANNVVFENLRYFKTPAINDYAFGIGGGGTNILFQNCQFKYTQVNINNGSGSNVLFNAIFRRSSFHRAVLATGHGQGVFCGRVSGITTEDCVVDHNGWTATNRDDSVGSGGAPTIFKHGLYFDEYCTDIKVRRTVLSRNSSHGAQLRGDAVAQDVVCIDSPLGILFGNNFKATRLLCVGSADIDVSNPRGLALASTDSFSGVVTGSELTDSIVCHGDGPASGVNKVPWTFQGQFDADLVVRYEDNIQYDWGANAYAATGAFPARCLLTRNNNKWDNESAAGSNTTFVAANVPAPERTAADYATLLGYASVDALLVDACATPQNDWALRINNWIRAGFGR